MSETLGEIGYAFEVVYALDGDEDKFIIVTNDVRMDKVGELAERVITLLCGADGDCHINSVRYSGQAFGV